jgi:hypothetical protein
MFRYYWKPPRLEKGWLSYFNQSKSIAQDHTHFVRQDLELRPLDLSMINR